MTHFRRTLPGLAAVHRRARQGHQQLASTRPGRTADWTAPGTARSGWADDGRGNDQSSTGPVPFMVFTTDEPGRRWRRPRGVRSNRTEDVRPSCGDRAEWKQAGPPARLLTCSNTLARRYTACCCGLQGHADPALCGVSRLEPRTSARFRLPDPLVVPGRVLCGPPGLPSVLGYGDAVAGRGPVERRATAPGERHAGSRRPAAAPTFRPFITTGELLDRRRPRSSPAAHVVEGRLGSDQTTPAPPVVRWAAPRCEVLTAVRPRTGQMRPWFWRREYARYSVQHFGVRSLRASAQSSSRRALACAAARGHPIYAGRCNHSASISIQGPRKATGEPSNAPPQLRDNW